LDTPRYSVSRKTFDTPLRSRTVPFTDEQWAMIYRVAREEYKRPGQWLRDIILPIVIEKHKNIKPRGI
jgi:hypothetical protein